jgi:hypothetical protein
VTKALVPKISVSICGANTYEGSELPGKGMKMRKVVVHDEDIVSMWVSDSWLPDGRVVEGDVVPFPEMLLGDNAWCTALGHIRGVGGPTVELTSVAILAGKVELNESVTVDVNFDALDVDGVAKLGVAARDEGRTCGWFRD